MLFATQKNLGTNLAKNRHNIIRTAMLRHLNNIKFPSDASECLHVHIARSDSRKPRKKPAIIFAS